MSACYTISALTRILVILLSLFEIKSCFDFKLGMSVMLAT
jgi:hypothetical protein